MRKSDFTLPTLDDLFSTQAERDDAKLERVRNIPLAELHPFKGHPFKVQNNEEMQRMIESIRKVGAITPALARPLPDGGYELISGHRRLAACQVLGVETMPVIVRELSDDEAVIAMVDANLQRETILPSEKAFAYKMKLDAIKHQGVTSAQVGQKLLSVEKVADDAGESRNQIKRYIRLTYLIPELLSMVDDGKIAFNPAVELSYLDSYQQRAVLDAMALNDCTPSHAQSIRLKKLAQEGLLDDQIRLAINEALAKRPADFDAFLRLMEASGFMVKRGRGGTISFLVPGQERATRLRASTLGDGYDPEDIKAVIAGERPIPEQPVSVSAAPRRVNLIVDIQERLRSGKGAAYARWAKVYNLKQMAAALQFMQEQNITEYGQLSAKAEDAVSRFHALTEQLRRTEADLSATSELMGAVVQYAKTRPVFDGYKAAKYSRKYLAEHEAELADYRAAKATMGELLGGEKLPKMAELKEKRRQLAARKKALYIEYRSAQEEMRQAVAVKANIDHLLGVTDGQRNKEQER